MGNEMFPDLLKFDKGFGYLQSIIFKDFSLEGISFRLLGVTLIEQSADWNIKTHKHSFFEVNYVTEGISNTTINNVEYSVMPGQFFLLPPGTFHSHREGKHKGFALRWEIFYKNKLNNHEVSDSFVQFEKLNRRMLEVIAIPKVDKDRIVFDRMLRLLELSQNQNMLLDIQVAFVQFVLCFYSIDSNSLSEDKVRMNQSSLENNIIKASIRFIDENYTQDIGATDVSNYVHLSYSHLSRLFKKYNNENINHYINKVRLEKAQHLLACTEKNMGQIANEVGYKSENYLYSIFKKKYGISPGFYRRTKSRLTE